MKRAEKTKLKFAMTEYLQLKGLTASQEKQMEGLKSVIVEIANKYPDLFVDGVLSIEGTGCLREVFNKPKLVLESTGELLNQTEQIGLITLLGSSYEQKAVNVTMVRDAIKKGNKQVLSVLKQHKVKLVQEVRIDIKKA